MARGKPMTLKEVPRDQIVEAAKSLEQVALMIKRRNPRGQLATVVGGVVRKTTDLIDGTIDQWLKEIAGGGLFRIEGWDPTNPLAPAPFPPYEYPIEGQERYMDKGQVPHGGGPRPPTYATSLGQAAGYYPPVPSPPLTGWGAHLSPASQWSYWQSMQEAEHPPAPGATIASDQMALRLHAEAKAHVAKLEAEKARAEERMIEAQERAQRDAQKMAEKIEKLERERAEERHKLELQMIERRFEAMTQLQQLGANQKNPTVEMLTALAPLATAMVTSGKKTEEKQAELQHQTLQAMLANATNQKQTDLPAILGAVSPLILQMLQNKGPEAQVMMQQSLFDSASQQMAMTAQFVQTMAEMSSQGEQPPWWLPAVQSSIEQVMNVLGSYAMMREANNRPGNVQGQITQPIPRGLPQPQMQTQEQPQQQQPPGEAGAQPPTNQAQGDQRPDPALIVQMIMASPRVPVAYKTPEWQLIMHELHREADVEETAQLIAQHLDHCMRFQSLPKELHGILEDPERTMSEMIGSMPVAQWAPEYCGAIVEEVIRLLSADQEDAEDEEDEDDVEEIGAEDNGAAESSVNEPVRVYSVDQPHVTPPPREPVPTS